MAPASQPVKMQQPSGESQAQYSEGKEITKRSTRAHITARARTYGTAHRLLHSRSRTARKRFLTRLVKRCTASPSRGFRLHEESAGWVPFAHREIGFAPLHGAQLLYVTHLER